MPNQSLFVRSLNTQGGAFSLRIDMFLHFVRSAKNGCHWTTRHNVRQLSDSNVHQIEIYNIFSRLHNIFSRTLR